MRDVAERAAVDERRIVLQRLHEVRHQRVLQQHRHRAVRVEIARVHGLLVARVADDDLAEPLLQVGERFGETEDRHHLGGDDDVEPVLPRKAVRGTAEGHRDVAQRTIVHVDDPLPRDAAHVDPERVAVMDVIVEQRGEQVVGDPDRVEVAGEVQVDVLHRHDLRIAAAGGPALHPEDGPERGFAQADGGLPADAVQRVAEADGGRRLALARRRRADRGHEDQLPFRARRHAGEPVERNLRLGAPVGHERVVGDREARGDLADRKQACPLGDLDVGQHCGFSGGCGRAFRRERRRPFRRARGTQMTGFAPPSIGTIAPVT